MISAVAARKAALAARTTEQPNVGELFNNSKPEADSIESSRPPSKRKASSQTSKTHKKRKEVTVKRKAGKQRYFTTPQEKANGNTEDAFEIQDDMIVVDSSDSDLESSSQVEDFDLSNAQFSAFALSDKKSTKRAWSPSMPVDSSEAEDEDEDETEEADNYFLRRPPVSFTPSVPELLSTFSPKENRNIFFLSMADISSLLDVTPSSFSSADNAGTLITLLPGETLGLLGTCTLRLLQGTLSILGTTLQPSSTLHDIYAPRSSPLPVLKSVASSGQNTIHGKNIPERLEVAFGSDGAVFVLQPLLTGVEGLGKICRTFDDVFVPSRSQKQLGTETAPFKIPGLFMMTKRTKDTYPFFCPPTWRTVLNSVENPSPSSSVVSERCPVYLVKGAKKTGKSTFARTLVNRLLSRYAHVAFLECDLGQSEFTPGGMVTLNVVSAPIFGPPFTHPALPLSAHYIGGITPRSSPSHYLSAVYAISEMYRLDVAASAEDYFPSNESEQEGDSRIKDIIPLVVNTMGWAKGLGADLTRKIEEMVQPKAIFEFVSEFDFGIRGPAGVVGSSSNTNMNAFGSSSGDNYAFQGSHMDYNSTASASHHFLAPVVPPLSDSFSAADHRAINILSYFHCIFPTPKDLSSPYHQTVGRRWDTELPLCAIPPFEVNCAQAIDKVVLTGAGSEDVVVEEIAAVLNGALVGLVKYDPGTLYLDVDVDQERREGGIPYFQDHLPPQPQSSQCLGLALIRGVSAGSTGLAQTPDPALLQLLTPTPPELLADARVLVKGEMELPIWGWLDYRTWGEGEVAGYERDRVPYLQWGKVGEGAVGAERRRVRRNLMRKGQQ